MSTTRVIQRGRIGESVLRADGIPKVRGEFAYSSDLQADGMLWGATLRSPHPSAAIRGIDVTQALTVSGVRAVLIHSDVPGRAVYGMEIPDQPVLASDRVRYQGEPVAIVAADHPDTALSVFNLGSLLGQIGRTDEAEPLVWQALATFTRTLPADHPHVQAARAALNR